MHSLWQDIRYGRRMLVKNPGFTVIAIVTLALGIGANAGLFSVVNAVLLNPLAYYQPERLVALYAQTTEFSRSSISYLNFLDWQRENRSFEALGGFRAESFNLTGIGEPERLAAEMVTANFFPILGVKPILGRVFTDQEDQLGGAPVALISEGLWKGKFGGSTDAVGKPIRLNGKVYSIVGVIPASFRYVDGNFNHNVEVYVPIAQYNEKLFRDRRVSMGMDGVGRLKQGVTLAQAKSDMASVAAHLSEEYPDIDKNSGVVLLPLKENVVENIRPLLLMLLGAVGFVLLIACANVASLQLARSTGRTREFAIRTALGAGSGRMLRQILTESVLLALAGGTLGLLIGAWGTQAAIKSLPEALPRAQEIHVDGRVLLFTFGASVLAGILFGLIPALKVSRTGIHETLKEGGRGGSGTRHRTQGAIVAVEMALALVLLSGAGLMIRSLAKLWDADPGFDPKNVLTFSLAASEPFGETPAHIRATLRQLRDVIAMTRGVQGASLSVGASPMAGDSEIPFWLDNEVKPNAQTEMKWSLLYITQPQYLKVTKIPLKRGRFLSESDDERAPFAIVIDEQFAKLYFGDSNPIGRHVHFSILSASPEIVGVVGHVKQWGLDSDANNAIQAQCYFPVAQIPDDLLPMLAHGADVMARTDESQLGDMDPIRRAVETIDSQIVVYGSRKMTDVIAGTFATKRFAMVLLGIFAGLATVLSSVGIYGVISYIASQRTHEIGVRMALGAGRASVLRMMLVQAGRIALIGVALGLVAGLALTRLMSSVLFGVSAHDPLTFAGVALLLTLVAMVACYLPAWRATRVDPMVALHYE